jgi:K+-transporting ATPase ATPase C chain
MLKEIFTSIRILVALAIITGIFYPALVTLGSDLFFKTKRHGSLLVQKGQIIGSKLLAQKFDKPWYFYSRPSASDYSTVPSQASNLSPASLKFKEEFTKLRALYGPKAPLDLLTLSASGLDPHISPMTALYQLPRIAESRELSPSDFVKLQHMVLSQVERPTFGFLGNPRVNVLKLNLLLNESFR